ncbi:uracil-DNA glycosylase family protein [Verrucosispora sp. WMMD573]|uniref:uracil-DNA glycosylase family protein n=1 Tax=Verrucosispora sp. WMMD573 TaxID=3015149 RepID=UPI0032B2A8BB
MGRRLGLAGAGGPGLRPRECSIPGPGGGSRRQARVVFVGEQPGDMEDQKGLPFVGPAGRLLRKAVDDAKLDPAHSYLTNAVEHFRFADGAFGSRTARKTPDPPDPRPGAHHRLPAQLPATIHPSAVLRADNQDVAYDGLAADLTVAARALAS